MSLYPMVTQSRVKAGMHTYYSGRKKKLAKWHTASHSGDVLVNLPTRMLNANRDTRVPPAKARQDWFTVGLRTWASAANREFEVTLVKEVLGHPADLSRHGAVDRQLAHEMLFQH